ncbi:ARM repeat-containing protein [Xylaria grammica]|nr:ARM repeat-containing protein [Xylaria grammica]
MFLSIVSLITLLAGGAIAWYIFLCRPSQAQLASAPLGSSHQPSPQITGVKLCQVYPSPEGNTVTDIDVIAIHGLDTDSPRTWTWKHQRPKQDVNWLEDPEMLPKFIPTARIFTCNWPADLFERPDLEQKMMEEFARLLLAGVQSRPPATNEDPRRDNRPIVFIASCLGGVVLMKALDMATHNYDSVRRATRGVVFLATPFRGTSFQDVADWAEPGLRAWASIRNQNVSNLMQYVKSTFELREIVQRFTTFCREQELDEYVSTFYETGKTSLPRKIVPWLPAMWSQEKPLVDKQSATLDIVPHPLPLDRPHIQMNKFRGPDDPGYIFVAKRVQALLEEVRKGRPVDIANVWIRDNRYSIENLNIERLSGEVLPMDQCYINLAIIQNSNDTAESLMEEVGEQESSPFSLFARLRVERPQEGKEIALERLFEPRATHNGLMRPNRLLIRGRAGVGKTTLCKKIIYEFTYRELWRDLFDCVLWVPLRKLKLEERLHIPGYNFKYLFLHEYFSQNWKGEILAEALWRAMDAKRDRILFILDGLDEVSQGLSDDMRRFLEELLNQANVIITSRPNAALPTSLKPLHLKLETIGFYPEQVDDYIKNAFTDLETGRPDLSKIEEIQSFLHRHELIRGLIRIPIQLDALCYTWNDPRGTHSTGGDMKDTMSAIYQKIDQSLWRKDAENLDRLKRSEAWTAHDEEIAVFTDDEHCLLELLAFNGMYYNVIDFEPKHRGPISREYKGLNKGMVLDNMLGRVSFLRSSDLSSRKGDQSYHFIHLTFQEYFAAQYFVRQWRDEQQLKYIALRNRECGKIDPPEFLKRNKYNPRYDIFWRFVAGLLNTEIETTRFFRIIEAEPRDILGPTHQRLVARCLNEVSIETSLRKDLEDQLSQWMVFASKDGYQYTAPLTGDMLSAAVLEKALQRETELTSELLGSISEIRGLSEEIIRIIASKLKSKSPKIRSSALSALRNQKLKEEHCRAIEACLRDEDSDVKMAAIKALQNQPFTEECRRAIKECLKDEHLYVRSTAIKALKGQLFTKECCQAIKACLKDESPYIRTTAINMLKHQLFTGECRRAIEECLKDKDSYVKIEAMKALQNQPITEECCEAIKACLKNINPYVRSTAIKALKGQLFTEEYRQAIEVYLEDEKSDTKEGHLKRQKFWSAIFSDQYGIGETIETLGCQLSAIAPFLKHEDGHIREEALQRLKGKSIRLSEELLEAVVACFKDEEACVRCAALRVFQDRPDSWGSHVQAIIACFRDKSYEVRVEAIRVLRNRPSLSEELLRAVTACLTDEDERVILAAIEMFEYQEAQSEELLQTIIRAGLRLGLKGNRCSRFEVMRILKAQPSISEDLLKAITAYLKKIRPDFQKDMMRFLGDRPALPEESLQAIAACLDDNTGTDVIQEASDMLIRHRALSYISDQNIEFLYKYMFDESFEEHISWHAIDGVSYITRGYKEYSEPWPDRFADRLREVQEKLCVPHSARASVIWGHERKTS